MSDPTTVTSDQLTALTAKLEGMIDTFSPEEQAALGALVALAGDGIALHSEPDVVGFGGGLWSGSPAAHFSLNFTMPAGQSSQGILIGLLKNGGNAMQDFHFSQG